MAGVILPEGLIVEEPVRLCLESNLLPDGSYGISWLIVTPTSLLVFARNDGRFVARHQLDISKVSDPKVVNLLGGSALEVTYQEKPLELVRFTPGRAGRFGTVALVLGKWLKNEEGELPDEEQTHCPKCGFPLEKGTLVCPLCLPKSRTLLRLLRYLIPYWYAALGLSLLTATSTMLGLVPPAMQRPLMDKVLLAHTGSTEARLRLLGWLVLAILLSQVLLSLCTALQGGISGWLGNHITHDVRSQLYQHLQFLSLHFYDKRQIGSVISRVNQDTGQLQQFIIWASQDVVINFLRIIGIGTVLCVINWKLALLVLAPAPLMMMLSSVFWRRVRPNIRRFFHRWGRVNSVLSETLNGLRVVKAFAQETREINRFDHQSVELARLGTRIESMWAFLFATFSLPVMLGTLLVWYFGGRGVLFGDVTPGTLLTFISLTSMFYQPVMAVSHLLNWMSRSLTAAERIFEV
ncbi:MAG TPA: ABC transporter transmembrane domain-containing protein, partial [Armatimonadota bacterium]